jgi:hypothetical protein
MIAVFGRKDLGTGILRNMTNGGDGISGYTHTEETKKLLSEKNSGKNNAWYGKNHTEETKSKMKESNKSRKRTPHSEETKRKIRESAKKYWKNGGRNVNGKNNSFYNKKHTDECKKLISDLRCKYLYTFISSESKIFETINAKQFCIDYNLSERYVYKVANGKQDNHKGWKITRRPRTEDDK